MSEGEIERENLFLFCCHSKFIPSAYQAIRQYSPCTPALIFVSSRRQTRLTALDLIAFLAAEDNPKQFLHLPENELDQILTNIKDTNLKLTLAFGIGMHHAGLQERDRKTCEELFLNRKIQILIATATLAWGVNLPVSDRTVRHFSIELTKCFYSAT